MHSTHSITERIIVVRLRWSCVKCACMETTESSVEYSKITRVKHIEQSLHISNRFFCLAFHFLCFVSSSTIVERQKKVNNLMRNVTRCGDMCANTNTIYQVSYHIHTLNTIRYQPRLTSPRYKVVLPLQFRMIC